MCCSVWQNKWTDQTSHMLLSLAEKVERPEMTKVAKSCTLCGVDSGNTKTSLPKD